KSRIQLPLDEMDRCDRSWRLLENLRSILQSDLSEYCRSFSLHADDKCPSAKCICNGAGTSSRNDSARHIPGKPQEDDGCQRLSCPDCRAVFSSGTTRAGSQLGGIRWMDRDK